MDLEKILKTGALVELEYKGEDGSTAKLKTLIDFPYTKGHFTIYAPIIKGAVFTMRDNDSIAVLFMTDNADKTDKDIYKINCRVEQRGHTSGIAVYKLSTQSNPEKVQRRGAFRLPIVKDFTMVLGDDHRLVHLTTTNISGTGLKSIVTEKLEKGTSVVFNLDTDLEIVQIPSTIVLCNLLPESLNKYDLRLQFTLDREALAQKLNAYLFKKQAEVIQKNIGPSGYSDMYYKLYEKDAYDPKKIAANKQSSTFSIIAAFMAFIATSAIFMAVPKDPQIIFKTLIKLNIVYNAWNYSYLLIGIIFAGLNIPLCAVGIVIKRRFRLPEQLPYNVPLITLLLYSLILFLYGISNYSQ